VPRFYNELLPVFIDKSYNGNIRKLIYFLECQNETERLTILFSRLFYSDSGHLLNIRGNVNNVFSSNLSSAFRIPSDTEIPMNLLESKQTFATVCQSKQNREQPSGLIINNQVSSSPAIAPIKTSIGDIYPARGIIKTVDGQVILTSYPTDEASTRKSNIYVECD